MRRLKTASNRHWLFIKEEILGPLNDDLAIRHGAEYHYEVPEESFDWDVEFSAIKDRSGNNLRETYLRAWAQPSLIGSDDSVIQLGVKVNWFNNDIFSNKANHKNTLNKEDVANLMTKTDAVLGSPLKSDKENAEVKKEVVHARPDSVTNQQKEKLTIGSVERILKIGCILQTKIANDNSMNDAVKKSMYAIQTINNAKSLNSIDTQQIEVQNAYDVCSDLKQNQETALLGFVTKYICDLVKNDSVKDADLYDILSRIERSISDNIELLKVADQKNEVVNNIEDDIMNLIKDPSIDNVINSYFKGISADSMRELLKLSKEQISSLRSKSLNLDLSTTPAPQVVKEYISDLKENPDKSL